MSAEHRRNPDSEECQQMERDNARHIRALQTAALYAATLADNEDEHGRLPIDGWRDMATLPTDGSKIECLRPGNRRHTALATPQGLAWENGIHVTDTHNVIAWRPAP